MTDNRLKRIGYILRCYIFILTLSRFENLYVKKISQGAHGVEPWTSRSAVECSTTELYPLIYQEDHLENIHTFMNDKRFKGVTPADVMPDVKDN